MKPTPTTYCYLQLWRVEKQIPPRNRMTGYIDYLADPSRSGNKVINQKTPGTHWETEIIKLEQVGNACVSKKA